MNHTRFDAGSEFKCKEFTKVADVDSEMPQCRRQEIFKTQSFCEVISHTGVCFLVQNQLLTFLCAVCSS